MPRARLYGQRRLFLHGDISNVSVPHVGRQMVEVTVSVSWGSSDPGQTFPGAQHSQNHEGRD